MHPAQQRVSTLDVLRGVAIFGMFCVNMTADVFWSDVYRNLESGSVDRLALLFVRLFGSDSFVTIFSFLFGAGFYVQSERRIASGQGVSAFWLRRLSGLLIIGAIANAFTLPAWILVDYAIFGFGLLLFFKLPPRCILISALGCLLISKIIGSVIPAYWPGSDNWLSGTTMLIDLIREEHELARKGGAFLDISAWSIVNMSFEFSNWRYYLVHVDILGLMLLGLFVGRSGAIWNREAQRAMARALLPWLLGIGFGAVVVWHLMAKFGTGIEVSSHYKVIQSFLRWPIGKPMLGLGYAAAIVVLMDKDVWRRLFTLFEPIGRMALTNYLFTCFVQAILIYQWGLGLYGRYFPVVGLLIAVACLPLQILASRQWLNHFAFGPTEWLWRCWTYGQLLPMMRRELST